MSQFHRTTAEYVLHRILSVVLQATLPEGATPKMIRLTAAQLTKLKGRMPSRKLEHDIGDPVCFNCKFDSALRLSPGGFESGL